MDRIRSQRDGLVDLVNPSQASDKCDLKTQIMRSKTVTCVNRAYNIFLFIPRLQIRISVKISNL